MGTYGLQGTEASSNVPGGRNGMTMVYHARTNSLYVYGGFGYDTTTTGAYTNTDRALIPF